jgi:hypothetical protein
MLLADLHRHHHTAAVHRKKPDNNKNVSSTDFAHFFEMHGRLCSKAGMDGVWKLSRSMT